ncbi:MAG: hypothetical protein P8H62_08885 [Henriciella sp.]|nr:hypothetical protein [Henriciella sp.]
MKKVIFGTSIALSLMLAACGQIRMPGQEVETTADMVEPEQAEAPVVEAVPDTPVSNVKTAEIDWASARSDFAARDIGDDAGMVSVAGTSNPPVPVLLPETQISIASGGTDLQFRPTADGYFAVQPGEVYDLIITGTDRLIAAPEGSAAVDSELRFEETMTGAQVSFSRYGASYLAEFMCKDPATAAVGSCIPEADALTIVEELLIAGTR